MKNTPDGFNGIERRRHKRFKDKDDALVFFGQETGTILDISKGGLSIHYTVFDKAPPLSSHLGIFLANSGFYLPHLSVSLVDEVQMPPHSIFNSLQVRRLSVEFGALSSEQQGRLEDFITKNTLAAS